MPAVWCRIEIGRIDAATMGRTQQRNRSARNANSANCAPDYKGVRRPIKEPLRNKQDGLGISRVSEKDKERERKERKEREGGKKIGGLQVEFGALGYRGGTLPPMARRSDVDSSADWLRVSGRQLKCRKKQYCASRRFPCGAFRQSEHDEEKLPRKRDSHGWIDRSSLARGYLFD